MSFLESHLSDRDIRTARAVNNLKLAGGGNAFVDSEFKGSFDRILRSEMEPIAARLHAAVSAHVRADSASLALADQMTAEFRDSPRRRRG